MPGANIKHWICALGVVWSAAAAAQNDLEYKALAPNVYRYTAWSEIEGWGRIGSNGLIVVDGNEAFLVDTPTDEAQTERLAAWVADSLGARIVGFVPGHWHSDCVGGMEWLGAHGTKTYAYRGTDQLLAERGRARPQYTFGPTKRFKVGRTAIECRFLGPGHATDNVVVWLPAEQILFGGCMVKELAATGAGNTEDAAPLEEWRRTVERVQKRYPDARIVVPGHGTEGGAELLEHTKQILNNQ